MKLDILVLAAHPDDAELGCGGTIAKHISLGRKVGVVDLTRGELGTRGSAETRKLEAAEAAKILGLSVRENLGLADGFFQNTKDDQLKIIEAVRKFQPDIVLANATYDRHPDHGRASTLIYDSCFMAGLAKLETCMDGVLQKPWRPGAVYHFIQSQSLQPDFIIDISGFWDIKLKSVLAYKTQFFDPSSIEPSTYISSPDFLRMIESRAIEHGHAIGVKHGEGFTTRRPAGVKNLFDLI
jgi:N-acetylglucosamine malate deacetylase 1